MIKVCATFYGVLLLLNMPVQAMDHEAPSSAAAAIPRRFTQEEIKEQNFNNNFELPFIFRLKERPNIQFFGTNHYYPWHKVPKWWAQGILGCDRLFMENVDKESNFFAFIDGFVTACGGIENLLLPQGAHFVIPERHEEFQGAWNNFVERIPPQLQPNLQFLKDIGSLRPGFVAILHSLVSIACGSEVPALMGMDHSIQEAFGDKPIEALEDRFKALKSSCFIEEFETVKDNFSEDDLACVSNIFEHIEVGKQVKHFYKLVQEFEEEAPKLTDSVRKCKLQGFQYMFLKYLSSFPANVHGALHEILIKAEKIVSQDQGFSHTESLVNREYPSLVNKMINVHQKEIDESDVISAGLPARNASWMEVLNKYLATNPQEEAVGIVVGLAHLEGLISLLQQQGQSLEYCGSNHDWQPVPMIDTVLRVKAQF